MNTIISSPKGGEGILRIHIYFPIGTRPTLVQRGGGGGRHVPEMHTPLDPPMMGVWLVICKYQVLATLLLTMHTIKHSFCWIRTTE